MTCTPLLLGRGLPPEVPLTYSFGKLLVFVGRASSLRFLGVRVQACLVRSKRPGLCGFEENGHGGRAPLLLSHLRLARVVETRPSRCGLLNSARLSLPAVLFRVVSSPDIHHQVAFLFFNQKFAAGFSVRSLGRRGQSRALVMGLQPKNLFFRYPRDFVVYGMSSIPRDCKHSTRLHTFHKRRTGSKEFHGIARMSVVWVRRRTRARGRPLILRVSGDGAYSRGLATMAVGLNAGGVPLRSPPATVLGFEGVWCAKPSLFSDSPLDAAPTVAVSHDTDGQSKSMHSISSFKRDAVARRQDTREFRDSCPCML